MGTLGRGLVALWRNRRRVASSIVGVLLGITFLSGTLIAVDTSARASLDVLLSDLPGDFTIIGPIEDPTALSASIMELPGVASVRDLVRISGRDSYDRVLCRHEGNCYFGQPGLAIDPSSPPRFLGSWSLEGSMALPRGEIVLSEPLARALNVSLDAPSSRLLDLWWYAYDSQNETWAYRSLAFTLAGIVAPGVDPTPGADFGGYGEWLYLVNIRDLDWIGSQLTVQGTPERILEVWIDPSHYVFPYDAESTRLGLSRLYFRLQGLAIEADARLESPIQQALDEYQAELAELRNLYLLLATPVVLLGVYLGAVGVDLAHAERRRHLAVLRARGASGRQTMGRLLSEAVAGGVLAAVLGLAGGILLSRALLGTIQPFGFIVEPRAEFIVISRDTIVLALVLSVLLMVLVSYRSAKRTAALPIVETLRYHAPGETRIAYQGVLDVVLIGLATATYTFAIVETPAGGTVLSYLLGTGLILLLPVAPVLLIFGAARLATRASGRAYAWAARASEPFAPNLAPVIEANLGRNPRRSSNIAVIIALGLGFGLFIIALLASQQAYQERLLRAEIGADVAIYAGAPDPSLEEYLVSLPDVSGLTRVGTLETQTAQIPFCCPSVHVIDTTSYFEVTSAEPWYFGSLGVAEARTMLSLPGNVLVSDGYTVRNPVLVGDQIPLSLRVWHPALRLFVSEPLNVTVAGVIRGLPGTGASSDLPVEAIYLGATTLTEALAADERIAFIFTTYLVDLDAGTDWRSLARQWVFLPSVRIYAQELENLRHDPGANPLSGFVRIEIAFMVLILTAGLALVLYAASLERDVEFAAIAARGASGRQIGALLLGEGFALTLLGSVIGVSLGILAAFLTVQALESSAPAGILVPYLLEVPSEVWILLVLAPLAILLAVAVISWRVARMNVPRVLKMRGG